MALLALALAACLGACQQTPPLAAPATPAMPAPPALHTLDQVQQARQQLARQKAQLQQQLTQQRRDCYQRFWVNRCLDAAQQHFDRQTQPIDQHDLALRRQARQIREDQRQLRLQGKTPTESPRHE